MHVWWTNTPFLLLLSLILWIFNKVKVNRRKDEERDKREGKWEKYMQNVKFLCSCRIIFYLFFMWPTLIPSLKTYAFKVWCPFCSFLGHLFYKWYKVEGNGRVVPPTHKRVIEKVIRLVNVRLTVAGHFYWQD